MNKDIDDLLEAIKVVVNMEGTWQEKKTRILEVATEDEKTALYELVAWFD